MGELGLLRERRERKEGKKEKPFLIRGFFFNFFEEFLSLPRPNGVGCASRHLLRRVS